MTKLLEQAVEAARELSPEEQDEIARMIFGLLDSGTGLHVLSNEDRAAIDAGLKQLDRGDSVSHDEVRAILAKYAG